MAGKKQLNPIVEVLMRRDGMEKEEAEHLMCEVRDMMYEAIEEGSYDEAETIFEEELGLEPDYILELIL